jgi:NADH-quinone oxidoreductase subunit N
MGQVMGDIKLVSLFSVLPELYLALATIFLLLYGVYRVKTVTTSLIMWTLLILVFTAGVVLSGDMLENVSMNGMFLTNRFTAFAKVLILASAAMVLLLSSDWLQEGKRPFEFIILLLLATLGLMLMVSANDLLTLYMALELSSLSLYVLASFSRDHAKSSEAGLKYFVLGALASGMMLFGMSLIYGFSGTTGFDGLQQFFAATHGPAAKALVVGLVLVMVGFCFKLSAVPFHMWTPDVYEGAPTPVTAFFATAPKVAALALFSRFLLEPFASALDQWQQVVVAVSLLSMIVGALAAIMQTNIKRLLAYSSIGHVGFMLMGLAAGNQAGVQAMLIYLSLYIFMNAGMFGCVLLMKRHGHAVEEIKDLAGLSRGRPMMAVAIAAFMFSMAGIPPLAGFFGKFYVILAALNAGLIWLAVAGVLTSVIGAYYYIKIVKVMYFDEPAAAFDDGSPLSLRIVTALGATVTFLFFLIPSPLVNAAKIAAQALVR